MSSWLSLVFQFSQYASPMQTLFLNTLHECTQETDFQSVKVWKSIWSNKSSKESYFYLMYSKHVFAYFRAWGGLEANLITGPNLELSGRRRWAQQGVSALLHSRVGGSGDLHAPAANPICLVLWIGSSAARAWWWRCLGGSSWVLVAMELCTSEVRGFGGLGGGMQSPGRCWRPQSHHPSVRYLWQKAVFTDGAWRAPQKTSSPAAGIGVPLLGPGVVSLSPP